MITSHFLNIIEKKLKKKIKKSESFIYYMVLYIYMGFFLINVVPDLIYLNSNKNNITIKKIIINL